MRLEVEIDDRTYNDIKKGKIYSSIYDVPQESVLAIANGTPIAKGYGRLIDEESLRTSIIRHQYSKDFCKEHNIDNSINLEILNILIDKLKICPSDVIEQEKIRNTSSNRELNTRKKERKMPERKFKICDYNSDGEVIARDLSFENAIIFVEGYYNKYYLDDIDLRIMSDNMPDKAKELCL